MAKSKKQAAAKAVNREFVARLMAVQAVYQTLHNQKPIEELTREYLTDGLKTEEDDTDAEQSALYHIKPDVVLFKNILVTVNKRYAEIYSIVESHTQKDVIPPSPEDVAPSAEGVKPNSEEEDLSSEDADLNSEEKTKSSMEIEPLLRSVLLCGVSELLNHTEIDAPLIVNDYLNVTHEFYEKSQVSLVNGVLDAVAKAVRD